MGVFIFSCLFGLFFIYRSKKSEAKLLLFLGLTYFFAGLVYLGDVLDFITILMTDKNIDNSYGIIGLINWMWFPGAILSAMYFGVELLTPKKKWYIFSIYVILSCIFELFLFIDPMGSISYDYPAVSGEDLINDNLPFESITFLLALIFLLSIIVFLGIGFLIKAKQSTGSIRRSFLFLSIGAFIYTIGGILDGLFSPGIVLIIIRSGMIGSSWMFYLGLRKTK